MTTYNWSDYSIPAPASFARARVTPEARMVSVLSQALQSSARAGAHWQLRCEWIVRGAARDELEGLLTHLNGSEHRIKLPMFDWLTGTRTVRGSWSGSPAVDGASQTGRSLNVTNGVASAVTAWALPGDLFTFDNTVRMVTLPTDLNASGDGVLTFWPPVRTSPADAAAISTASNIEGVYYLAEPPEIPITDELANGDALSRIAAVFVDDVLA